MQAGEHQTSWGSNPWATEMIWPQRETPNRILYDVYGFVMFFKKCRNWLNRRCRGCQEACGFNLRWVINSKVDFLKNRFFTKIRTTVCRLPSRGLFFSEITRPWKSWDVFWWFRTQIRTTVCRLPGRGLFFSEITRPWNLGMCFGDFGPISGRLIPTNSH